MPTLALIHTVSSLLPVFAELTKRRMPAVETFNIVDESLLRVTIREGSLSPTTARRLAGYVESAREAGADAVLVTCSSMGPAVEIARDLVDIPVLRVDEPMAEAAIASGRRISVLATLRTTLEPTEHLIARLARDAGVDVEIEASVVPEAFERLSAGDVTGHDERIAASLGECIGRADVVVLAQASMARVLATMSTPAVPVLSSPEFGVARAAEVLDALAR